LSLDYTSWREYVTVEFGISQAHAYRRLHHARVLRAVEQVTNSPIGEIIPEGIARELRPWQIPVVINAIQDRIASGDDHVIAVQDVITTTRLKPKDEVYFNSRRRADRSNRNMAQTAQASAGALCAIDQIDFSQLDAECMPEWMKQIRQGARNQLKFSDRLDRWIKTRQDQP